MIDHITFHAKDIDKTKSFYTKTLAPLGYELSVDNTYDGTRFIGFIVDGKIDTWFTNDQPATEPGHLAWSAKSRKAVDEFYAAAIAAGAKDNGAPGLRAHYHANYYGAFVIDPDGNNIEAVCHLAE